MGTLFAAINRCDDYFIFYTAIQIFTSLHFQPTLYLFFRGGGGAQGRG